MPRHPVLKEALVMIKTMLLFLSVFLWLMDATPSFAVSHLPSLKQDFILKWNSLTDTQKLLLVTNQLQAYRDQHLLTGSTRRYVNIINSLYEHPSNLFAPVEDVVYQAVLMNEDFSAEKRAHLKTAHQAFIESKSKITTRENFIDALKEGVFREFHANGRVMEEWAYKDGKKNGIEKVYYPNGNLYSRVEYNFDQIQDVAMHYYEDGSLATIDFYDQGVLNGISKKFYRNGSQQSEVQFQQGVPVGMIRTFYEDGRMNRQIRLTQ